MLMRGFAAVVAAAIAAGVTTSCAVTGSPATADPAVPTLESAELPQPAPPARPRPAPATSSVSDEAQIRQVTMAYWDAYNGEDWVAFRAVQCAKYRNVPNDAVQEYRTRVGQVLVTITAVRVAGNTATVTLLDQLGGVSIHHLVRENGWTYCGTG